METNSIIFIILQVLVFVWMTGWAYISYTHRESSIISKRGMINMILFSIAAYISFFENVTLLNAFNIQFNYSIACVTHLYINYVFFGLFMFGYLVRAVALLFEKHSNMIKLYANNADSLKSYLAGTWWIERLVLRAPSLLRKLEKAVEDKDEIVEKHLNLATFSKPAFLLKSLLVFIVVGVIGASCALAASPEKTVEHRCTFSMYLPVYAFTAIIIILGYFVSYLLRKTVDPFFFRWEFVIVMNVVIPICFILALATRQIGYGDYVVFIVFAVFIGHAVSVVYPNLLVLKMRKLKFESLQTSRKNSLQNAHSVIDIRKKAAESFCLELVNFKEDYDKMKANKDPQAQIEAATLIYKKYFAKNAAQEIAVSFSVAHQLRIGMTASDKNILVLDGAYEEIMTSLARNLGLSDYNEIK